jgi:hypothetical protein
MCAEMTSYGACVEWVDDDVFLYGFAVSYWGA